MVVFRVFRGGGGVFCFRFRPVGASIAPLLHLQVTEPHVG